MSRFAALAIPIDQPGRMTIMHPLTGQPLRDAEGAEAWIEILSNDSQKAQAFDRSMTSQMLQQRNRKLVPSAEEIEAKTVDRLATLTVGWRLLGLKGELLDVACEEAAARELYSDPSMLWLVEQLVQFQGNRANFSKASSKS